MSIHADKNQEDKSQSVAKEVSQKGTKAESIFQFVDNRSQTMAIEKLQAMADNYALKNQQLIQKREKVTPLPDGFKSEIENPLKAHISDTKDVAQRIQIKRKNVSDKVWQVYKELSPEAQLLLRLNQDFNEFFELSPNEQIDFLRALDSSTMIINTLIQRQTRAIMGPQQFSGQRQPLQQLQLQFLENNPNFLQNLLAVTQGHTGTFHFSSSDSLSIRTWEPRKALLGPEDQGRMDQLVKYSQISIHSVMNETDLSSFLHVQNKFQQAMQSMDDLRSIGFEFEFASFAGLDGKYKEQEIIPSHQLMASSAVDGNFFGLSWRLESDSKNTLELVSPPFVFSKDKIGDTKSDKVKKQLEKIAGEIATQMDQNEGTLPDTAQAFLNSSIGRDWKVIDRYKNFRVLTNKKSGNNIYGQRNVSMSPQEIGELIESKFKEQKDVPSKLGGAIIYPTTVARLVRDCFLAESSEPSDTVRQAIAIFSRYASNALAIPSFRHRQVTGQRKDTMATEVKETLGIWVKTDALNVLKHLLKEPTDLKSFIAALGNAQKGILEIFNLAGEKFIQDAKPPEPTKPTLPEILDWLGQNQLVKNVENITKAKTALIEEKKRQIPDPSIQVSGYVDLMKQDVIAFVNRVLNISLHEEANPKLTTSEFLNETFGKGEGVRKGTYLKGIRTSKGPMYVTELR